MFTLVNTRQSGIIVRYNEPFRQLTLGQCDIKTILQGLENLPATVNETLIKDYNCPDGTTEGRDVLTLTLTTLYQQLSNPEVWLCTYYDDKTN